MSILIAGGTLKQQKDCLEKICKKEKIDFYENNPDILIIKPEPSIGIEEIRRIKRFLSKKSWHQGKVKFVLIENGQLITIEAQNAILKTLEEPPKNSLIVITAGNKSSLLPTIISRCQIVEIVKEKRESDGNLSEEWDKIVSLSLGERLKLAEKLAVDKESLKEWLDNSILNLQKKLPDEANPAAISFQLRLLTRTRAMIESNVTPLKAIDWLMLKL